MSASSTSAPFVTTLRARGEAIVVGTPESYNAVHLRVQLAEAWDAVRVTTTSSEPVRAVKLHALQALHPGALFPDDYVVKVRGQEIFDESQSLQAAGVVDGGILLLMLRRRRPVR